LTNKFLLFGSGLLLVVDYTADKPDILVVYARSQATLVGLIEDEDTLMLRI